MMFLAEVMKQLPNSLKQLELDLAENNLGDSVGNIQYL